MSKNQKKKTVSNRYQSSSSVNVALRFQDRNCVSLIQFVFYFAVN